jgi:hypothetical protein
MRTYTMTELYHLTRAELLRLGHDMAMELSRLPAQHPDHETALGNFRRIRRELARRDMARGLGR